MEIWKDVPGYESRYQVSDLGNVRSMNYLRTGRSDLLKPSLAGKGYLRVALFDGSTKNRFLVHRLAMLAFVGNAGDLQVNHKNGIKSDNRLVNLEYCTMSENMVHRYKDLGIVLKPKLGESRANARFTNEQVLSIRRMYQSRQYTYKVLAGLFGVHMQTIAGIVQKRRWGHI